jgi:hypothetical protein
MPAHYYFCLPVFFCCSALYDVCLLVLCLHICVMTAWLNDLCLPVWCLPTCSMSGFLYLHTISGYLYNMICCLYNVSYMFDFCLPVWCLLLYHCCLAPCMMSSYLYDVNLPAVCLPTWKMPSYVYDVCLPYDVFLALLCLPTCIYGCSIV